MRNIEVCLSPELLELYGVENKLVVVVDILRATSCMTTGLAHGVKSIIPVSCIDECSEYKKQGYVAAAERDGKMAEGFDMGNSPFSYMSESMAGKTIAMTTTNGTKAIKKCNKAFEVIIGSFLNKSAIINYLNSHSHDVLILCAGWKGKMNLEDTLFAGALIESLKEGFYSENDSAIAALTLYKSSKRDMFKFITANSSHYRRLKNLNLDKDIKFCLQTDIYPVIPVLKGGELVALEMDYAKVG